MIYIYYLRHILILSIWCTKLKVLLNTYERETSSATLTLTFQNNCHPNFWTDQKIKYTERLDISTKQFSAHREYLKITFQSYNQTGEFLGFCSSVDEVSIPLGFYNMSLGNWSLTAQGTLVVLTLNIPRGGSSEDPRGWFFVILP